MLMKYLKNILHQHSFKVDQETKGVLKKGIVMYLSFTQTIGSRYSIGLKITKFLKIGKPVPAQSGPNFLLFGPGYIYLGLFKFGSGFE